MDGWEDINSMFFTHGNPLWKRFFIFIKEPQRLKHWTRAESRQFYDKHTKCKYELGFSV